MQNQIDEVLYVNENLVIVYLAARQFKVETSNGTALALTKELLFPYFERLRIKDEVTEVNFKVAA